MNTVFKKLITEKDGDGFPLQVSHQSEHRPALKSVIRVSDEERQFGFVSCIHHQS